jgi:hypothetical protein
MWMRDRPRTGPWPLAFVKHRWNSGAREGGNQILPNEANFNLCGICGRSSNMKDLTKRTQLPEWQPVTHLE